MKSICEIFRSILAKKSPSGEELESAIRTNLEYFHEIRPPELPGVYRAYIFFIGRYRDKHPESDAIVANRVCRETHPEWWPRTMPQNEYVH